MEAEQYCTYVETWCAFSVCVCMTVPACVCPGSNGPVAPARGQQVEQGRQDGCSRRWCGGSVDRQMSLREGRGRRGSVLTTLWSFCAVGKYRMEKDEKACEQPASRAALPCVYASGCSADRLIFTFTGRRRWFVCERTPISRHFLPFTSFPWPFSFAFLKSAGFLAHRDEGKWAVAVSADSRGVWWDRNVLFLLMFTGQSIHVMRKQMCICHSWKTLRPKKVIQHWSFRL